MSHYNIRLIEQELEYVRGMYRNAIKLDRPGDSWKREQLGSYIQRLELVLASTVEHTLVGLYPSGGTVFQHYLPIYRAKAGDKSFDYIGATYDQMEVIAVNKHTEIAEAM